MWVEGGPMHNNKTPVTQKHKGMGTRAMWLAFGLFWPDIHIIALAFDQKR